MDESHGLLYKALVMKESEQVNILRCLFTKLGQ